MISAPLPNANQNSGRIDSLPDVIVAACVIASSPCTMRQHTAVETWPPTVGPQGTGEIDRVAYLRETYTYWESS